MMLHIRLWQILRNRCTLPRTPPSHTSQTHAQTHNAEDERSQPQQEGRDRPNNFQACSLQILRPPMVSAQECYITATNELIVSSREAVKSFFVSWRFSLSNHYARLTVTGQTLYLIPLSNKVLFGETEPLHCILRSLPGAVYTRSRKPLTHFLSF